MRESIAEQCSKVYGMNLQPEDITHCDGCRVDTGRLFSGCFNCEVRKCASLKNIESCAYCSYYPGSQIRLEEIRHTSGNFP
jgi:hypothetical protein